MKNRLILRVLVFGAGFLLALIVFFPLNHFKGQLLNTVYSQTGIKISSRNISMGTGLGMGLARGGIFAFHFEDFQLVSATGQKVVCKNASFSPHIWPFFIGQVHAGIRCEDKKSGQILAKLEVSPVWNPEMMDVFVTLEDMDLALVNNLVALNGNFNGKVNGTLSVARIALKGGAAPRVEWEISGSDVAVPALTSPLLSLPPLKVGPIKTKGLVKLPKLNIETFEFGNDLSSIKGNWAINFELNANMMPLKGEWRGTFKGDSEIERLGIGGYKLDQLFGPIKAGGTREFKKVLKEGASPLSLLMNPEVIE